MIVNDQSIQVVNSMDSAISDLREINDFILSIFRDIWGAEYKAAEKCEIYNDPNSSCPMLMIKQIPLKIRLKLTSLKYWAQAIFQLSHELCHYMIRQHKSDKDFTLGWFEEIICEAVSLCTLEMAYKKWKGSNLSKQDPEYDIKICGYLQNELAKDGTDKFAACTTLQLLTKYEKEHIYDRDSHRRERNQLYKIISKNPKCVLPLCKYADYVNQDKLTIDFDGWGRNYPYFILILNGLRNIQPVR